MNSSTKNALKEYADNKRWQSLAISAGVTFVSTFIITIGAVLQSSPLDPENLTSATLIALILTGLRAGVRSVVQYALSKLV